MSPKARTPKQPARAKGPDWTPRAEWILAGLLLIGALYLHVTFCSHAGALWRDEVNSVNFASMPSLGQAYASLRYDSFPLLSTVFLRAWIHTAGGGDPSLRLYALLVGIFFLAALGFAGRALGGGWPLLSLALVGWNPWVVRTVDSIRPYGWGMVFIVATLGCGWSAVRTGKPLWLILTAVGAIASVQCMYQNAFLLAAILIAGAFTAWRSRKNRIALALLAAGAIAAASLVPYLSAIRAAGAWGVLIRADIPLRRIVTVLSGTIGVGGTLLLVIWIALAILTVVTGVRALRQAQPAPALFGATGLVLATGAYLAAIIATHVQTEPWYYVPLIAVAGPLLDGALNAGRLPNAWKIGRLVVPLAAVVALALPSMALAKTRWTSVDVAAAKVGAAAGPEDLIVLNPFWIGMPFQRYYHGPARWITVPPMGDLTIVRYDRFRDAMTKPEPTRPVLDAISRTLQSGHHVFWVEGMNSGPGGEPARVLPPAPLPESGWFLGPYLVAWGRGAAYHLESHGLKADILDVSPGAPVMSYEAVTATEISGWR